MVENILGQGIDIHLLGLRELVKDLGEPLPDIFQDEAYRTANHFALSTSQVWQSASFLYSVFLYSITLQKLELS